MGEGSVINVFKLCFCYETSKHIIFTWGKTLKKFSTHLSYLFNGYLNDVFLRAFSRWCISMFWEVGRKDT